jgi:hypothetical protein
LNPGKTKKYQEEVLTDVRM